MASTDRRNVLRSLPALLALLVALFVAPQASATAAAGSHARPLTHSALVQADAPAAATSEASSTLDDEPTAVVGDTTRALSAQRVTGPSGSRAPPAAL